MSPNPVENNVVTRFLLGLAVILGLFLGGGAGGALLGRFSFPYSTGIGVLLGSLVVFVAFAAWYTRYDATT